MHSQIIHLHTVITLLTNIDRVLIVDDVSLCSQIPPNAPLVLDSSPTSLPTDPTPIVTQAIPEQVGDRTSDIKSHLYRFKYLARF